MALLTFKFGVLSFDFGNHFSTVEAVRRHEAQFSRRLNSFVFVTELDLVDLLPKIADLLVDVFKQALVL
jgi:hypothetical protein